MGRSRSTTERRRRLGMPPSELLSGPEGAAAEIEAAVSRSSTPPMVSSCGQAAGSVARSMSVSPGVSSGSESQQDTEQVLSGLTIIYEALQTWILHPKAC